MDHIVVERVHSDGNNEKNNSNNHPKDPSDLEIIDLDYEIEIKKTNLMNYAHLINYPILWFHTFNADEIKTLVKCSSDCIKTGNIRLYKEELAPIISRLNTDWSDQESMLFFRFNAVSPKDGLPEYPIWNAEQVIEKIVTSKRAWNCLLDNENTIYFVKYDSQWDIKREFRVFIYKKKVTAISQYHIMTKSMLSGKSNNDAKMLAESIRKYLEDGIIPNVCGTINTDNLVCDIYVNFDASLKIIEFNSFGYWLASGSALFHWLDDKKKLYNTDGKIYLRFIK
jgi:hypothetical protein